MPTFSYRAKDRFGILYEDTLDAIDARRACQLLTAKSWFVLRLEEIDAARKKDISENSTVARERRREIKWNLQARTRNLPIYTEQMAQLLKAGLRLSEALEVMARRNADPAWRAVFIRLRMSVIRGKSLSEAMTADSKLFNELYRAMVASGEASGHLAEILERLAKDLQRREKIRQRVRSALIYPLILVVMGVLTVAFFMVIMLPKLSGMFKELGQSLPLSTQILVWTSEALVRWGWVIPLIVGMSGVFFKRWLQHPKHRLTWDRSSLRWPILGNLLSLGEYSRLMQTLAALLQSGVALVDGLFVVENTLSNVALREAVREVRIQVRGGKGLHSALVAQKLFPGLMLDMLAVGKGREILPEFSSTQLAPTKGIWIGPSALLRH